MRPPRDYVYISDAKVAKFAPQAGRFARRRLRTVDRRSEVAASVAVGAAGLSAKSESSWRKAADQVERLGIAERLIRDNFQVGSLEEETLWFEGELNMEWDYYSFRHEDFLPETYAVIFCGERLGQALALGGSALHLTDWGLPDEPRYGNSGERLWYSWAHRGHPRGAAAAAKVNQASGRLRRILRAGPEPDPMGIFEHVLTHLRNQTQGDMESFPRLRFFAQRLMQKDHVDTPHPGGPTRMTLATPLWVARAGA